MTLMMNLGRVDTAPRRMGAPLGACGQGRHSGPVVHLKLFEEACGPEGRGTDISDNASGGWLGRASWRRAHQGNKGAKMAQVSA